MKEIKINFSAQSLDATGRFRVSTCGSMMQSAEMGVGAFEPRRMPWKDLLSCSLLIAVALWVAIPTWTPTDKTEAHPKKSAPIVLTSNVAPAPHAKPEPKLDFPYGDTVHVESTNVGLDWQLTKSIIETESAFRHRAVSPVGAQGLMQLMPFVARKYGVKNPFNPRENIRAGLKHLLWHLDVIDGHTETDRIKMALAAYNGGIGHLRDAQRLARKFELDPKKWTDLETVYPFLEKRRFHSQVKWGYCQGRNIIKYVRKIHGRYEELLAEERQDTEGTKVARADYPAPRPIVPNGQQHF